MSSRVDCSDVHPTERRVHARTVLRTHILVALGAAGCSELPATPKASWDGLYAAMDKDADGYTGLTDCNDADPDIHPDADEQCNGIDDNCSGEIDEGVRSVFYRDADGDTYGSATDIKAGCEQPPGYVQNDDDCNDRSAEALPGGEEVCDGLDNDCDGNTDDIPGYWPDDDGDGYGTSGEALSICDPMPDGYADNQTDCDDGSAAVHPGAVEVCLDAVDNDCDGLLSCLVVDVDVDDSDAWCSLTWGLVNAAALTWDDSPCSGCDYRFGTQLELTQVLGDAPACADVGDLFTELLVESDRVAGDLNLFAGEGFSGGGTITAGLLTWYADPFQVPLGEGVYGSIAYGGELFSGEVEEYYYGYYGYYEGRPLSVDGEHLVAESVECSDWRRRDASVAPLGLSPSERERAVAAWTRAGLSEHASVASFNRFVIELMSLGAPPDLVMESLQAAADEVVHARDCFSVASALAGRAVGPGALPVDGILDDVSTEGILVRLLSEGCVEETISTSLAAQRLAYARDPLVRETLQRIVDDETRHAGLAWRTARWLLSERPDLVPLARATLTEAMARPNPIGGADVSPALRAHGVLSRADRARERERTLRDVVAPAVSALFAVGRQGALDAVA